jgi:uncharacterized protein with FMN-binding domain
MHRGLVTLSASAVAAIYMAGYLRTQAADAGIGADAVATLSTANTVPVVAAAPVLPTPTLPVIRRATQPAPTAVPTRQAPTSAAPTSAPPPPATAAASAAQVSSSFKDGTYNGQGTSRRGDVWVSVQIQAGQITNVSITRSTLQYPVRDIANLPSQVVQRQSAQVDIVSRATYSSTAFRTAVTQALASAKA